MKIVTRNDDSDNNHYSNKKIVLWPRQVRNRSELWMLVMAVIGAVPVTGGWFGIVVAALITSTNLSYVEPGWYWDW